MNNDNFDIYNNTNGNSSLATALQKVAQAKQLRDEKAKIQEQEILANQQVKANWFERTLATGQELLNNIGTAFLKLGEGVVDAHIAVAGLFGADVADIIKYDATSEIMKWKNETLYGEAHGKYDESWLREANDKVQNTIIGVEQGIGSVLGGMALNSIPYAGPILYGMGAGGQAFEEALNEESFDGTQGDYAKRWLYGVASGVIEVGVEKLSSMFGEGLNKIAEKSPKSMGWLKNGIGQFTGNYKGQNLTGKIVTAIGSAVSEGSEEAVTEMLNPLIKTIYSGESVSESYKNNYSSEQVGEAFLIGALTSLVTSTATNTYVDVKYGKDGNKIINDTRETLTELNQLNNNQTSMSENEFNAKRDGLIKKLSDNYKELENIENSRKQRNTTKELATMEYGKEVGKSVTKLGQEDVDVIRENFSYDPLTNERISQLQNNVNKTFGKDKIKITSKDTIYKLDSKGNQVLDSKGNPIMVNAQINTKTGEIEISKKISKDMSVNKVLGHELKHYIDTNSNLGNINQEVIKLLKESNLYEQQYQTKENKYGDNKEVIEEEIVADYFGDIFSKDMHLKTAFKNRSLIERLIDKLKKDRAEITDSTLRDKYAKAIRNLNQSINNDGGIRYAVQQNNNTNGNNNNIQIERDSVNAIETIVNNVGKNVRFVKSTRQVKIQEMYDYISTMQKYNADKVEMFVDNILTDTRIHSKPIIDTLGIDVYTQLKEQIVNDIDLSYHKNNGNAITKSIFDSLQNRLKTLNDLIDKTKREFWKLRGIKEYFKQLGDKKKTYGDNLEGVFSVFAKELKSLKVLDTSTLRGNFRDTMQSFENALQSPLVQQTEAYQNGFTYFNSVIEFFNYRSQMYANQVKKPSLDSKTQIIDMANSENLIGIDFFANKTEVELAIELLGFAKRIITQGNNKTYKTIDGIYTNARDLAVNEANEMSKISRVRNGFTDIVFGKYAMSIIDTKAYFNVIAGANESSSVYQIQTQLRNAQYKTDSVYYDLVSRTNDFVKENRKTFKKIISKKPTINMFNNVDITVGEATAFILLSQSDGSVEHLVGRGASSFDRGKGKKVYITPEMFLETLTDVEYQEYNNIKDSNKQADKERKLELKTIAVNNVVDTIKKQLGTEFDEYMDILKDMYSRAGIIYQNASIEMNGYAFNLKQNYYPINAGEFEYMQDLGITNEQQFNQFVSNTMSPSFTKATTKGANNGISIKNSLSTAMQFSKMLSSYAGITLEVKNINKLLKAKIQIDGFKGGKQTTLLEYITETIDPNFKSRVDGLFKAMQGISDSKSPIDKALKWLRGKHAIASLGLNIKVILSQFLSYPMAGSYLSTSSLAKGLGMNKNRKSFNWLMDNSTYAKMRYFQNNVLNAEGVGSIEAFDRISEIAMKPISAMDKLTLTKVWYASQEEIASRHKGDSDYAVGTDLNSMEAITLFEQVAQDTQPQYDPLGNGSITRVSGAGSEIVKGELMYSSVLRKYFSRITQSVYNYVIAKRTQNTELLKKSKTQLAKTMTSFMTASVLMTMLTTLAKSLRGKYKDKEQEEIMLDIFKDNFATNFVGMLPFIKSIYGKLVNGYDLNYVGYQQINGFFDMLTNDMPKIFGDSDIGIKRNAIWNMCLTLSNWFGVPVKNIYTDIEYVLGGIDTVAGTNTLLEMQNFFYNTKNSTLSTLLKTYTKNGKDKQASAVIGMKFKNYVAGEISSNSAKEIQRLYKVGVFDSFPSSIPESININGKVHELSQKEKTQFKEYYNYANEWLDLLINNYSYQNVLNDEERAEAIKKMYSMYYDYAKTNTFEDSGNTSKLSYLAKIKTNNIDKYITTLTKLNNIKQTSTLTRKEQVQKYINRQKLKPAEKYLMYKLSGYGLNETQTKLVQRFLITNGIDKKQANLILE